MEEQDLELKPPTTTDFNMVAEQSFIHHGNTFWNSVPHPTFLASDSGATTATLSEQSAKREAWTMVGDEHSPTLQDCLQEDDVCKVVLS